MLVKEHVPNKEAYGGHSYAIFSHIFGYWATDNERYSKL